MASNRGVVYMGSGKVEVRSIDRNSCILSVRASITG
jgi:hypothetical protein